MILRPLWRNRAAGMGQQDLDGSILDTIHQQTGTETGHGSTVLRSWMIRLLSSRTVEDVPVAIEWKGDRSRCLRYISGHP